MAPSRSAIESSTKFLFRRSVNVSQLDAKLEILGGSSHNRAATTRYSCVMNVNVDILPAIQPKCKQTDCIVIAFPNRIGSDR